MNEADDPPCEPLPPPAPPAWRPEPIVGRRIGAALLDLVPLTVVAFGLADRAGARIAVEGERLVLALAVTLAYYGVAEALTGASPGKALLGLRVCDERGARPSTRAVALRTVFRLVDAFPAFYLVGGLVMVATPRKQRIGDLTAGTYVVALEQLPESQREGPSVAVLAGLVAAVAAIGLVATNRTEDGIGGFSLDEAREYAVAQADGPFAVLDADAIVAQMVDPFARDPETAAVVERLRALVGAGAARSTLVDERISPDRRVVELGERLDVAEYRFEVEYDRGDGELFLAVVDDDGTLRVLGWDLDCQACVEP